ncbi:MAG: IS30 family transposase [Lentisphaeria bacterium]
MKRNTGLRGYRPKKAQRLTDERKHLYTYTYTHTRITDSTWQRVEILLREEWSTEKVSGWLKKTDLQPVSPEWIYQYILTDKKAGGDLHAYLRCQKKLKKRYGSPDRRGQLKKRVSVDDRPAVVDERSRVGDWEMLHEAISQALNAQCILLIPTTHGGVVLMRIPMA